MLKEKKELILTTQKLMLNKIRAVIYRMKLLKEIRAKMDRSMKVTRKSLGLEMKYF